MGGPDLRVTAALFVKFNRVSLPSWNQDPVRIPSHHDDLTDPEGRAPNNCTTYLARSRTKVRLTHERPSVPPKTHRIWNPGGAPRPNPLSFLRYGWPFKSYRGVKIPNFPKSGAVIGSTTLRA